MRHAPVLSENAICTVGEVLAALAEGLGASAAERVLGYGEKTISMWVTRTGCILNDCTGTKLEGLDEESNLVLGDLSRGV
jgi:hypothetical protein